MATGIKVNVSKNKCDDLRSFLFLKVIIFGAGQACFGKFRFFRGSRKLTEIITKLNKKEKLPENQSQKYSHF
jgi:hypothetical protein